MKVRPKLTLLNCEGVFSLLFSVLIILVQDKSQSNCVIKGVMHIKKLSMVIP